MVSKISRYIGTTVFSSILLVLLLIVGFDVIASIIDEQGEYKNNYNFLSSLIYVLINIPSKFNEYFPLAALIGCLNGVGSLVSTSEITVMRANGVSLYKIVLYAFMPVLFLVLLSITFLEFVTPITNKWARTYKDLKMLGESYNVISGQGYWHKEGNEFMHFGVIQPGGVLYRLTFYELSPNGNVELIKKVDTATFIDERWLMENIKITQITDTEIIKEESLTEIWNTSLTPEALEFLSNEPEQLSPVKLYQYANYLETENLDAKPYWLSFWQKVLSPLAVFSLVIIALAFVFGPLRSSTMGYRIFIGVLVGIAFQFTQNLLGPISLLYGLSPLLAVIAPVLFCFIIGVFLLYRAN